MKWERDGGEGNAVLLATSRNLNCRALSPGPSPACGRGETPRGASDDVGERRNHAVLQMNYIPGSGVTGIGLRRLTFITFQARMAATVYDSCAISSSLKCSRSAG